MLLNLCVRFFFKCISILEYLKKFIYCFNNKVVEELMSIEHPIGYVKTNIDSKDLEYTIASCDYYTKGSTISGQHICSLFRIESFTGLLFLFIFSFLFSILKIYILQRIHIHKRLKLCFIC